MAVPVPIAARTLNLQRLREFISYQSSLKASLPPLPPPPSGNTRGGSIKSSHVEAPLTRSSVSCSLLCLSIPRPPPKCRHRARSASRLCHPRRPHTHRASTAAANSTNTSKNHKPDSSYISFKIDISALPSLPPRCYILIPRGQRGALLFSRPTPSPTVHRPPAQPTAPPPPPSP